MSGTAAPGTAAAAGTSWHPGGPRRGRTRRWVAAGAVVVVAAGLVVAGVAGAFGTRGSPETAGGDYHTSTAVVTRRSLASQVSVNATLGFAGSYTVTGQGGGKITWLPVPGRVIRQGQVLYRTGNAVPVVLLYGRVPAWRALTPGLTGQDVAQLSGDLVRLGYATRAALGPVSGWDNFSAATGYAVQLLQAHLGLPVTGSVPLGQVVFKPSALRVTKLNASLGADASGTIMTATSVTPVVAISLDAAQQNEIKAGDKVAVTLPDGAVTPGVVSSVGTVATGSGTSATVPVAVRLTRPKAAGGLDQAPVTVAVTTGRVTDALVVPVNALLARPDGRYAVEVVTAGRRHHLVPVSLGLFDDAAGLVQVTAAGLAAGQHVVVPAV